MDQISPPMRIALAAVLAFAALWFVALRPKPVTDVATESAPVAPAKKTAITDRPAQAKDAVNKLNATSAKREAATGSTPTPASAKAQAAKPKVAKADATPAPAAKVKAATPVKAASPAKAAAPAKAKAPAAKAVTGADAVVRDVKAGRTVVLLFWDGKSSEDQAVRRAVQRTDRRDGKVRVHVANLKQISRYGAITQGVPVTSSPTVVIIGEGGKAEVIRGLTTPGEINDTVSSVVGK